MMRKILLSLLPFAAIAVLTSENLSDNGRAGATGSPGEVNCTNCHSDFAVNSGGGSITIQNTGMTAWTYTPGVTYNMSVTVSKTGVNLFGVGIEALTSVNNNAGTLIITDAASTQLKSRTVSGVSRVNVVHQLNGGASSNSKIFIFDWTAPAVGTGTVTFYFAGVTGDGDGGTGNDYVYTGSQVITEASCAPPSQPSAVAGSTLLCPGSSVTFSVPNDTTATSYTWSLPSDWTGTSTVDSITVVVGSLSGTISVAAVNACGPSTASTLSVSPTIIVANPAITNISCIGANDGHVVVIPSGGTGPYLYSWSTGGTTDSISGLSPGTYAVVISDANGCSNTDSILISDPAPIVANPTTAHVSCFGAHDGSITLIAGGGSPPYTYFWLSGGITSAVITGLSPGYYSVMITDSKGCTMTDSVLVTEPPVLLAWAGNNVTTCSGSGISIGGNPVGTGGTFPYTYLWSPMAGLSSPVDPNPTATLTADTIYSITVTDMNGCTASSTVLVTVNPLPSTTISQSGDSLFASGSGTYQWYFGTTQLTGETNVFYIPTQNGNYTVSIMDANGCFGTSPVYTVTNVNITGITDEGIVIFPNPVSDFLFINITGNLVGSRITLYDVTGKIILQSALKDRNNKIDLTGFNKGFYTIVVENGDVKKIVRISVLK